MAMIPLSYSLRSLMVRKATTFATAFGIALVVFVFASVMMLGNGIKETLGASGREDTAIVMSKGAQAELGSTILQNQVGKIAQMAGVAQGENGPLAQAEMVVVITHPKVGTSGVANVTMRGMPDNWLKFRSEARIVAGREPKAGTREVVIGRAARGRFQGFDIGKSFAMVENQPFDVVGVFAAGGGSLESEVWGDLEVMRTMFDRPGLVSSVHVRLMTPGSLQAFKDGFKNDPQLREYEVERETKYYEKQANGLGQFISFLGYAIAVFFAVGAMIGAIITMYGAVATRQREIGTLRALGFSRISILLAFLFESLALSAIGGVIGVVAAMGMTTVKFSTMNFASWSEVVFRFIPNPGTFSSSIIFAMVMGLVGGLLPAIRAARMSPIKAMRG